MMELGSVDISFVDQLEMKYIAYEFEGVQRNATTEIQANVNYMERGWLDIPPLGKIYYTRDAAYFYCHIYLKKTDKEQLEKIIGIIKYFPTEKISSYPSVRIFYEQEILEIRTLLTSGQSMVLSNMLEQNFFVNTKVFFSDTANYIYLYPRSGHETKILQFLNKYFGKVEHNGNTIRLNYPNSVLSQNKNDSNIWNIRIMRINSNIPIPELYGIIQKNGLTAVTQPANERFVLIINVQKYSKAFGSSMSADIGIIDARDHRLLVSHTIVTPNFQKHAFSQITASIKEEIIIFLNKNLPLILQDY
jgi:hypothetical protein